MSTSSTQTTYQVTVSTGISGGAGDSNTLTLFSQDGMSDAWVNAIYQALKTVTPPTGCTMNVQVNKTTDASTIYTTDYTNPISFT